MVFKATFNNILVILCRWVFFVEETGVPGENQRHAARHWQTLSHNVISSTPRLSRVQTHNKNQLERMGSLNNYYVMFRIHKKERIIMLCSEYIKRKDYFIFFYVSKTSNYNAYRIWSFLVSLKMFILYWLLESRYVLSYSRR